MNTTTATHRMQTISALSLALLIGGTASAHHRADTTSEERHLHGYEDSAQACANDGRPAVFNLGTAPMAPQCVGISGSNKTFPAPIRLAKPLSDSPYRSDESIRYSF